MEIATNIIIAIISGSIGVILTHIFYKSKLKKEQKMRFQNVIGDRMAKSLMAVRDIELKANVIEVYNIENTIEEQGGKFDIAENAIYPSIMNDKKSLLDFHTEIVSARFHYGKEITGNIAVYLWYAEKYFGHLLGYLGSFANIDLHTMGTIFIKDIQDWQRAFDKEIVSEINRAPTKLEIHEGPIWDLKKEKILEQLWNKTVLKKVINNETSESMELVWSIIDEVNEY